MTGITDQAARLIASFDGASVPREAIDAAKLAIRDCIGVALAGYDEDVCRIVRDTTLTSPGPADATVWGSKHRTSLLDAALVNGTAAHALDYDDQNRSMLGHPSAVLVPALFALGEYSATPGRRILEAYILGLQVMGRLGGFFGQRGYDKSWHATAVFGTIGVAASAAYLHRFDFGQSLYAIGIAASEASSIKKNFGSMVKPLHVGSAARKGLWAAQLARAGLTSNLDALDGRFGFFEMFDGEPRDAAPDEDWAHPLDILETGLVYKQYPCCGGLHALVDNAIELRRKYELTPAGIEAVECRVNPNKVTYLDRPHPGDALDAKFSIQYCVAAALADGAIRFGHFTDESLARPDLRALTAKVRIAGDPTVSSFGCIIDLDHKGTRRTGEVALAKGAPSVPLSEAELRDKFFDCTAGRLGRRRAERLSETLMTLEDVADFRRVVPLLHPADERNH